VSNDLEPLTTGRWSANRKPRRPKDEPGFARDRQARADD